MATEKKAMVETTTTILIPELKLKPLSNSLWCLVFSYCHVQELSLAMTCCQQWCGILKTVGNASASVWSQAIGNFKLPDVVHDNHNLCNKLLKLLQRAGQRLAVIDCGATSSVECIFAIVAQLPSLPQFLTIRYQQPVKGNHGSFTRAVELLAQHPQLCTAAATSTIVNIVADGCCNHLYEKPTVLAPHSRWLHLNGCQVDRCAYQDESGRCCPHDGVPLDHCRHCGKPRCFEHRHLCSEPIVCYCPSKPLAQKYRVQNPNSKFVGRDFWRCQLLQCDLLVFAVTPVVICNCGKYARLLKCTKNNRRLAQYFYYFCGGSSDRPQCGFFFRTRHPF